MMMMMTLFYSDMSYFNVVRKADTGSSREKTWLLDGGSTVSSCDVNLVYKIVKTIAIFWIYFAESAFVELVGPILPELVAQTNSSYEDVMRSLSMCGVGFVIGGVLAGLPVDRWFEQIDIIVVAATALYTAICVWTGYVTNIDILFVMFLIQGILEQVSRTGCIRMTLKLWKQHSSIGLYAIHLGSSIAYIISPKITGLFVDSRFSARVVSQSSATSHVNDCATSVVNIHNETRQSTSIHTPDLTPKYPANFVHAFWIFAVLDLIVAVILIGFYIHKRHHRLYYDSSEGADEEKVSGTVKVLASSLSPKSCSPTKPVITILVIASVFLYYGVFIPTFRIFPKMIFSYARDEACFSVEDATTLQSTFFILVLAGRMVAFLLSSHVHPKYIMQASALGYIGTAVPLYMCADNRTVLWIGVALIGLSNANMLPGLFAFVNHYVEMTAVAMIVPLVGGAIGDVVVMYFLGPDYETNVGPKVLWTYMLALSVLQFLAVLLLQIFCHIHGDRYKDQKGQDDD